MRRKRPDSRKPTPIDEEAPTFAIEKEELMKQLDKKMNESQSLKAASEQGVTIGFLATPQASIFVVVPSISIILGEGTSQGPDPKQTASSSQAPIAIAK